MKEICILLLITFCFCMSLLFTCCAGQSCFFVEGSKDGLGGKVQYCYDPSSSQKAGVPVLSSSAGESVYGLSENEVILLNEMLTPPGEVKTASIEAGEAPIKNLKARIAAYKKK